MTVGKRSSSKHKNQTRRGQKPSVGEGDPLQRDPGQVFGVMQMFSVWIMVAVVLVCQKSPPAHFKRRFKTIKFLGNYCMEMIPE